MSLNKLSVILALVICLDASVFANKVSDYEYNEGQGHFFVANRNAEKCVALTFDDGPHPYYTEKILEILDKYNAKATFFVIGKNAQLYPDIVLKEHSSGHEIGNHTFSHPDLKKLSEKQLLSEINQTDKIIEEITGKKPTLFRPPGGYLSNPIVDCLTSSNTKAILWSWRQDTRDWACPSASCIVKSVLNNLNNGDIILFHDYNSKASPTPEALERILRVLSEKGYKFVTVSELMSL